ncbi:hypothetical protein HK100_009104, partial [Physocladia obscura]
MERIKAEIEAYSSIQPAFPSTVISSNGTMTPTTNGTSPATASKKKKSKSSKNGTNTAHSTNSTNSVNGTNSIVETNSTGKASLKTELKLNGIDSTVLTEKLKNV